MSIRKVLHFSTADNDGGSGRSAYRIHLGLRELGWDSRMIVGTKVTSDKEIETVYGENKLLKWTGYFLDKGTRKLGLSYQWFPWGKRLVKHSWVKQAKIFQFYNLHGGYFPLPLLPKLSKISPIVWRLSDMWPITGHCVYPGNCDRWKTGCGSCPAIREYVELGIDTSSLLWKQKKSLYSKSDITVVAPSSWIERAARESPLLGIFPIHVIPNGLNTQVFRPINRDISCEIMGWAPNVKRILFIAHGLDDNPRKGGDVLIDAIRQMQNLNGVELLVAGVGGTTWDEARLPIPVRRAGYIKDDRLLAILYNCADVVVVPSKVDNLPNTLLEAMACGVPVVATDAGGVRDALEDGVTGFLVDQGDVIGFALRISELLNDMALRKLMGENSRITILKKFSSVIQANKFSALYENLILSRNSKSK